MFPRGFTVAPAPSRQVNLSPLAFGGVRCETTHTSMAKEKLVSNNTYPHRRLPWVDAYIELTEQALPFARACSAHARAHAVAAASLASHALLSGSLWLSISPCASLSFHSKSVHPRPGRCSLASLSRSKPRAAAVAPSEKVS